MAYAHPLTSIGKQSVASTNNLFQGYWSHVEFRKGSYDPNGSKFDVAQTDRYLGVVNEGVLEVSREDNEFMGTMFPRVVELLTPAQVGLKFSGEISELYENNLHLMIGGDIASDSNFVYPGASCSFGNVMGSLRCLRERCDGFIMEAVLFKTLGSGGFQIGGAAEVISSAAEFNALDDSNNEMGGAASRPLGYIYAPDPAAGSMDPGNVSG